MINLIRTNYYCILALASSLLSFHLLGCNGADQGQENTPQVNNIKAKEADDLPAPFVPPVATQGFAGSKSCIECHEEIYNLYVQSHPMGHSFGKVLEVALLEDYTDKTEFKTAKAPKIPVTMSYQIEKKNNNVLHHEIVKTDQGDLVYDKVVPIAYAMGSGKRGRSYLINHSGLMFMSPVTWYSEAKQWDLSPGYKSNNLHFGRRVVDGCLSCHVGRVARIPKTRNRYEAVPFIEESISCEQCHGPGKEHIEYHRLEKFEGHDPVVNPAHLSSTLRDDVCFQCHLIGEHRLPRYKRSHFDFRPGDNFTDIWTVFLKKNTVASDSSTAAVSQVEQMLGSSCYQNSEGKLGCISCHDPHQLPDESIRINFYRNRCLNCHGLEQTECSEELETRKKATPADSCIFCHMPKLAANDVPHTSQTDHRILRRIEQKKTSTKKIQESLYIFREDQGTISESELLRAEAISLIKMAEQRGNPALVIDAIRPLERWLKVAPDDLEAQRSLGTAYWLAGDIRKAIQTWEKLLEQSPDDEDTLRRFMMLYHEIGEWKKGIEYGRKLIKINSWDYEYYGRLAHLYGQIGQYEQSARAGEKAIELNPSAIQVYKWLAGIYASQNKLDKSEAYQHMLEQLSPP